MNKKDFGLSVKEVSEEGTFEGYGSTFGGAPDSYGDIILPGAFSESLTKHHREGTMPLMLFGHKQDEVPIGTWTDMAEDGKGLWLKGSIDLEDPLGSRVHRALKQKRMRGLSIGFQTLAAEPDKKRPGVTNLKKVDLWEVSVVNFPANRRSLVDAVKSHLIAGSLPTLPEFEEFLREAGFSKTQATAIAGKGLTHLLRGEPGKADDDAVQFLKRMIG